MLSQLAQWIEYPFTGRVDFRTALLILVLILLVLWIVHDGHRIHFEG